MSARDFKVRVYNPKCGWLDGGRYTTVEAALSAYEGRAIVVRHMPTDITRTRRGTVCYSVQCAGHMNLWGGRAR